MRTVFTIRLLVLVVLCGCAEDPVRWSVDDPLLLPFAEAASVYWRDRGVDVAASDDPNTRVSLDPGLTVPAHAEWSDANRLGCDVTYSPRLMTHYLPETVAGILAHEFGHCLGLKDRSDRCDLMNSDSDCLAIPQKAPPETE